MNRSINKKLAKIIKSVNDETKALAIKVLESPIKWDLINFYHANPYSIHTAKGLANMIGRLPDQVFEEAEGLTRLQILNKVCENGDTSSIYSYEPSSDNTALLDTLIELSNDDHALIDELLHILKEE